MDAHHVFRYSGDFADAVIERASGAYVHDRDGRAILDFTSGQMSAILGHSHPEIVDLVRKCIAEIDHQSTGRLAAAIVEPVLSSGGIIEPPTGYLAALSVTREQIDSAMGILDRALSECTARA